MPEIGTSGLLSGDGKRGDGQGAPSYRAHPRLYLNGHGQNEDGTSERIPVPCDLAAATVNPHRLAAFPWAVIRHAGSAPWRSCDLAALDRVRMRSSGDVVNSSPSCR